MCDEQSTQPATGKLERCRWDDTIVLADYQWIMQHCEPAHVYVFEFWHLEKHEWHTIPWRTSRLLLAAHIDTVLVRFVGVICRHFGRALQVYDDLHGLCLPLGQRVSDIIPDVAPANELLVLAWMKV